MKLTEQLSSSQQVDALELALRSLTGGDKAVDDAVAAVLAEVGLLNISSNAISWNGPAE